VSVSVAKGCLRLLLASAVSVGAGCADATVDSHMNTVADIEYVADAGGDYWQSPEQTAVRRAGDCEDMAFYLQRLLRADGIPSTVVFGVRNVATARTGHAWVECVMYDELYVLDPTCRLTARRSKLPRYMYYRVPDQPDLAGRLRAYLARTGDKDVNIEYESAMMAAASAGSKQ
jgi:transglutaminase-like putative cysteine protease